MRVISDQPDGIMSTNFILMGIISEAGIDYACLMDYKTGNLYIEEIHWGPGRNIYKATLHWIKDDETWKKLFDFVTKNTTIFSPRKIKEIRNQYIYFYSSEYLKTHLPHEDKKEKKFI